MNNRLITDKYGNSYEIKNGLMCIDGNEYWHYEGQLHREDEPAIIFVSGDKLWYLNGMRHRLDGPAVELKTGLKEWFIEGVEMAERVFNNHPLVVAYKEKQILEKSINESKLQKKVKL